jgi:signal transduction histidine kinase
MDTLAPPRRRLRPPHWIAIDCAFTALMLLVYVELKAAPLLHGIPSWAAIVVVLVAVVPAAFRRCRPRTVLVMVVAAGAVASAFSSSPVSPLAAAFVMYLIPLRFPRRDALWLLAGTLLVTAAGLAAFAVIPHGYGPETGTIGKAAGLLLEGGLLVTVAWLIGYSVGQQRGQAANRREQAERKAREQLAETRRARSEERLQISRELHDVVAHTLSVIAVQAGVAGYVVETRPEEAARALSSIEQTSRSALHEMRALFGVLRDGETGARNGAGPGMQDAALVPAPGLADLDTLVERTGEAGVRVELSVRGERPRLPAGLDLAAYRVIQEAVTNVIKHAATDRCLVAVAHQEDTLMLEVTDNGTGGAASGGGELLVAGNGIIGMRERAAMYGGEVRAAPLPGRGFRVTARFPLADTELAGAPLADNGPIDTRA